MDATSIPAQLSENRNTATTGQHSSHLSDPAPEEPPAKKVKTEDALEHSLQQSSSAPELVQLPAAAPVRTIHSISNHKELPVHEMVGGSSVRQYLNKNLTKHVLDGLKLMAKEKPEDPLRELGQFLIKRSEELKD